MAQMFESYHTVLLLLLHVDVGAVLSQDLHLPTKG